MSTLRNLLVIISVAMCIALPAQNKSQAGRYIVFGNSVVMPADGIITDTLAVYETRPTELLSPAYFDPYIFQSYQLLDPLPIKPAEHPEWTGSAFNWIDDAKFGQALLQGALQYTVAQHPDYVRYNSAFLPEPPAHYRATINAETAQVTFEPINPVTETSSRPDELSVAPVPIHWLRDFTTKLQFSQAYISPNWYQGGNNSLYMIGQGIYNIKLNTKFFPKYMFETTIQYKLGMNSAPDDSIHSYNISDDLLQVNSTFGVKAVYNWYYTVTGMLKTQLFRSYPTNSRKLKSAFLSPGELNIGLGMTYSYANPRKTFSINISLAPAAWNMKTCLSKALDETVYGIKPGRHVVNEFGSTAELKMNWKIAYNISYASRIFAFSDYDYFQGDWENTFAFAVNQFLSTQIYVHLRYDSSTPRELDSRWHKLQLKEILSFGISYTFSNHH